MFSGKSDSSLPISLPRPARKGRGMGGLSHPGQRARHRGAQCWRHTGCPRRLRLGARIVPPACLGPRGIPRKSTASELRDFLLRFPHLPT